jgi:hypothetical protein
MAEARGFPRNKVSTMTRTDAQFLAGLGIRPFETRGPVVSFHPRVSDYRALMARVQALGTAATNWCTRYREEERARRLERRAWELVCGTLLVAVIVLIWRSM